MTDKPAFRSQFRLPAAVHEQLLAAVAETGRSLNAELVYRLERSFQVDIPGERRRSLAAKELADAAAKVAQLSANPSRAAKHRQDLEEAVSDWKLWRRQLDKLESSSD